MNLHFYKAPSHPFSETMLADALKRQAAKDKANPRFQAQFQRHTEVKPLSGKKEYPGSIMSCIRREVVNFDGVFTGRDLVYRLPQFPAKSVTQTLHDAAKIGVVVKIGKTVHGLNIYRAAGRE